MDLSKLPSPFYRVSIKAIILDEEKRLLVGLADTGHWETPGGGWEHSESIEDCISREIKEELGVEINQSGELMFLYRGRNPKGYMVVYLAFPVTLKNLDFKGGDLRDLKFVTKEELLGLEFDEDEALIKEHLAAIWPSSELE